MADGDITLRDNTGAGAAGDIALSSGGEPPAATPRRRALLGVGT